MKGYWKNSIQSGRYFFTPKYQSGFWKNHSYLDVKVLKGFDKGLFTGMILIDHQKAFDTINHRILLCKLHAIGFSVKTVAWFKSHLSDRAISSDVRRGSVLGPVLFLLYVNDMALAFHSDLFLYADDSGLTFQHKDIHTIEHQLNKDLSNLGE